MTVLNILRLKLRAEHQLDRFHSNPCEHVPTARAKGGRDREVQEPTDIPGNVGMACTGGTGCIALMLGSTMYGICIAA
jgi:hypothetical protein